MAEFALCQQLTYSGVPKYAVPYLPGFGFGFNRHF
jgi:hypothetical protein